MGPCWRAVALPVVSGFARVERHHVHAMQFEQFNLGNNILQSPILHASIPGMAAIAR
jgi:hypothetical protein